MSLKLMLAMALAVGLARQTVAQTVLVDNLSEAVRADTQIANPEFWAAQSFFPDNELYLLNSIEVLIGNSANSPEVVAELRGSDVNNEIDLTPAGLLTTFVVPTLSAEAPSIHEFLPLNNVNLQPNTRYWFLLGSANGGSYDWSYAQGGNFNGSGTVADYADSSDAGGTWNYHFAASPFDPYLLRVNAGIVSDSILVSNFAEPLRAATPIGNNPNPVDPPDGPGFPWYWAAQQFVSDDLPRELFSIEARVGDGSTSPPPVVVAQLHADDGGSIGALVATFTVPDVTGPLGAQTFLPVELVALDPNTAYWFVLGSEAPGDGTYFMEYANSNLSIGTGTLGNFADSTDSGATWNYGDSSFPYFIQVNVTTGTPFLAGDYNENGTVDGADYTVWRDSLGSANSLPNDDTPGVDQDDYTRWKQHFGESGGGGAFSGGADASLAVPEPAPLILSSSGLIAFLLLYDTKRRG